MTDNLTNRWRGLSKNVRGAVMVSVGGLLLVIMSTLVKVLGHSLHSFQIVFFRCLIGLIFLFLLRLKTGFKDLSTQKPFLHVLRSVIGVTAMICVFYSVTHMRLADATAILFSRSLFVIVLAFVFLKEIVGWKRAIATAVGFAGILSIAKPGTEAFQPVALVAAAGAFLAALIVIVIKRLSATEPTMVIMFYYTLLTTVFSLVPALVVWRPLTTGQILMLTLVGLFGVAGQSAMTFGFSLGDATVVVPFDYLRLVFATGFGLVLFGEFPDILSVVGAILIVGSNLYIVTVKKSSRSNKFPPESRSRNPAS